jgi:hypothetical protein
MDLDLNLTPPQDEDETMGVPENMQEHAQQEHVDDPATGKFEKKASM